jgi:hypothetical protein
VTHNIARPSSPILRDIFALVSSNTVARFGSLALAVLLARATRALSEVEYALTFTAIAAAQMMISLDRGLGSLAVDLTARGIRLGLVVEMLHPLREKLRRLLRLALPAAAVIEYLIFRPRNMPTTFLHVPTASLVFVQLMLVGFVINFGVYERVLYGSRSARDLSKASAVGLLFSGLLLLVANRLPNSVVPGLAIVAVFGGVLVARSINRIQVAKRQTNRSDSEVPGQCISDVDVGRARSFWILQICGVTAFGFDQLVVSVFRDANEASTFSAHSRYFQIGASFLSVVITSVWPPMSAAISRADFLGARRLYFFAVFVVAAAATIWSVPVLVGLLPVSIFKIGEASNKNLLIPMAIWFVVFQVGALLGQVQAAVRDLKFQIRTACRMAVANAVLSVVFCWKFGAAGVVWGSLLSYPILVLIPVLRRFRPAGFWTAL